MNLNFLGILRFARQGKTQHQFERNYYVSRTRVFQLVTGLFYRQTWRGKNAELPIILFSGAATNVNNSSVNVSDFWSNS